jgi:threonine dehydratase
MPGMIPDLQHVLHAKERLSRYFPVTRLVEARALSAATGTQVQVKLESDLPTGSFKVRGALYALMVTLSRRPVRRVIASSTGNHGAAVAYAAQALGIPASIFLPAACNPVKRARIAALGAEIVEQGRDLAAAAALAAEAQATIPDAFFLNDATDPDLPAGPGVIGLEILAQQPAVDTVIVPMGDTALIRGVASAVKQIAPRVQIVGVQAERAPSYYLSWTRGTVVETDTCDTIADGLATRTPTDANVQAIKTLVDRVVLVTDDDMLHAIATLLFDEHIVAEPAGAAATAALLTHPTDIGRDVVALVTGHNIAPDVLRRAAGLPGIDPPLRVTD